MDLFQWRKFFKEINILQNTNEETNSLLEFIIEKFIIILKR